MLSSNRIWTTLRHLLWFITETWGITNTSSAPSGHLPLKGKALALKGARLSSKCNRGKKENILRSQPAQALARTGIDEIDDKLQQLIGDSEEIAALREEETKQPVDILIGAALPRGTACVWYAYLLSGHPYAVSDEHIYLGLMSCFKQECPELRSCLNTRPAYVIMFQHLNRRQGK